MPSFSTSARDIKFEVTLYIYVCIYTHITKMRCSFFPQVIFQFLLHTGWVLWRNKYLIFLIYILTYFYMIYKFYVYRYYIHIYNLYTYIYTHWKHFDKPCQQGKYVIISKFSRRSNWLFFFNGIATRGQYMSFPKHQSVGYKNLFTKPFK